MGAVCKYVGRMPWDPSTGAHGANTETLRGVMKRKQIFQFAAVCMAAAISNGCVTVEQYKNMLSYEPDRMPSRIEARVKLDVAHTVSPEAQAYARAWGNGPEMIGNYEQAVRAVIINDVVKSGLFASVQEDGSGEFDYLIRIRSQDIRSPDRFSAELQVCDWGSKRVIGSYKREQPYSNPKNAIRPVLAQLKADVLAGMGKGQMPRREGVPLRPPDQQILPALPGSDLKPQI